jgi:hypothetical protein
MQISQALPRGGAESDFSALLTRINNEAKVRRSTKLIVLRKAKVMSFEDIEVARVTRAAKEVIKSKGKRGRSVRVLR